MNLIKKTRIRNRQKTANAVFYVNIKVKIIHDKKHKSLFLNSENRAFLRLHKEYNLLDIINKKLFQQKCDFFTMKRRIDRLTYELDLSLR
jgi:CYTH domain-containing protein